MTRNLASRLESTQERILELYENDSDNLNDHIEFWDLTKRENEILFVARREGLKSLGGVQVPSLAASENRAKGAIENVLLLRSLASSQFGSEKWTQQQVSRERLMASPPFTFKKGGQHLQVQFDNDPENEVEYTAWDFIYYMENERWYKASGQVDVDGLYYVDHDGLRIYYVEFQAEAKKYSTSGIWSLLYNNTLLKSVGSRQRSSTSSEGSVFHSTPRPGAHSSRDSSPSSSPRRQRVSRRSRSRRYSSSSTTSSQRSSPRWLGEPLEFTQTSGEPRRGVRGESLLQVDAPGGRRSPRESTPPGSGGGHRGRRSRSHSRSPLRGSGAAGQAPPSASEVGAHKKTPGRGPSSRLGRLLQEARDPPGICVAGPPNILKCLRYTIKCKKASFKFISTTFSWTYSNSPQRFGTNGRIIILFDDNRQRQLFLETVSLPKSVSYYTVNFNGV